MEDAHRCGGTNLHTAELYHCSKQEQLRALFFESALTPHFFYSRRVDPP